MDWHAAAGLARFTPRDKVFARDPPVAILTKLVLGKAEMGQEGVPAARSYFGGSHGKFADGQVLGSDVRAAGCGRVP